MLLCQDCANGEAFLQYARGHERRVTMRLKGGTYRADKGVWKTSAAAQDGFVCAKCSQPVALPAQFAKGLKLDDEPIDTATRVDVDQILEGLKKVARGAQILTREDEPAEGTSASFDALGVELAPVLRDRLVEAQGVSLDRLYSHQVEALGHVFDGKNVVLQTPTASGKSLCYLLPTLNTLIQDEDATALFVFPLKALAFDQRKKIAQLSEGFDEATLTSKRFVWPLQFGSSKFWMGSYERETRDQDQADVKQNARLVLTNPDSIHMKILPWFVTRTGSWERFLANLRYVVFDEIHTYRGLFGANVACVLRRLQMMCEQLGAFPQFFCSSATLSDPKTHAEDLVGQPFEAVTQSGTPRHRKVFALWNPGETEAKSGGGFHERREPTTDAVDIACDVLLGADPPIQTITFMRTLAGVERFNINLRNRLRSLGNPCAAKTKTYKSTLTLRNRNEISEGLLSGQVAHVTATNALELGIDIGDMNACLMIGYPGTVMSTIQQSGRVGRKSESVVVLLLRDDPLEQWFARNPELFFEHLKRVEPVRLPIQNPHVLSRQLACAMWDLKPDRKKKCLEGLTSDLVKRYFGAHAVELMPELFKDRKIQPPGIRGDRQTYWIVKEAYGDIYENIRAPMSIGKFVVRDEDGDVVGECDSTLVLRDLFPDAVWINEGNTYLSKKIHRHKKEVEVRKVETSLDYYTIAMPRSAVTCAEDDSESKSFGKVDLGLGPVTISREVKLYRKVPAQAESKKKEETLPTFTNPIEYDTTAFWIDFGNAALAEWEVDPADVRASVHAVEHLLRSVFPVVADIDPGDLGSTFLEGEPHDPFVARLYLYDSFAGGTGLAECAFVNPKKLFDAAYDLLASCKCKEAGGCPRCVVLPWCEYANQDLLKDGALRLLKGLRKEC